MAGAVAEGRPPRIWIGPGSSPRLAAAVRRAGGVVVEAVGEASAVVWHGGAPADARTIVHDGILWVQLDSAGVDRWLEEGVVDARRMWTSIRDVFAPDVAEHAVAFVLAAARRFPQAARAGRWSEIAGDGLGGRTVGLVGAGAIGREAIARLRPFGVRILALTRSGREVEGAERSFSPGGLHELLAESDYAVLSAPLTPETRGLVGADELERLGRRGWLVNVGRGPLVVTDALVDALRAGAIAGACLDVTDPEPLPDDHPLWSFENVLVTPHVANPPGRVEEPLARLVEENVSRFGAGEELRGVVDLERGY